MTPRFPWLLDPKPWMPFAKPLNSVPVSSRFITAWRMKLSNGVPLMRPLLMEFPDDPKIANLSDQWMMGGSLMAAPMLQTGAQRSVYLPAGGWYAFGSNLPLKGNAPLKSPRTLIKFLLFVRAGSILPLGPVINTPASFPAATGIANLPRQDATFTLYEDDGDTVDYLKGQVRRTTFTWQDKTGRLSWKSEGPYAGRDVFQNLRVVLFDPRENGGESTLNSNGQLHLSPVP